MKRGIYLHNTPLDEALRSWNGRIVSAGVSPLGGESIPVEDSLGRVTAEPVFARISSPFYHASAMDGFAVRFAETFGAAETSPVLLEIGRQAVPVDTGDPLPDGFNAVIMIEDVNPVSRPAAGGNAAPGHEKGSAGTEVQGGERTFIEIIQPATPWQHVRVTGEDIVCTELIIPENHRIRPVDIGAVISGGHTAIPVRRKPRVVIIPTGSELVEPGSALRKGNIIEYNSRILSALVDQWGGDAVRFKPVPDDIGQIKAAIKEGCRDGDLVIVNAGSSAGTEDFTARAVSELGELILHGISIKPGKPVILSWVDGRPLIGIPGYPVSAYITFSLFARDLIYRLQGLEAPPPDMIHATMSRQVASPLGQEEFLRVKVGKVGDHVIATPVGRGAGVLMSLVRAEGFVRIPAMSEGLGAGAAVDVEMMTEPETIANTVVCIGSHDNSLDVLANFLKKKYPRFSLSSAHVGSMGGLMALKRGEAHIAGTHLLDEETGEYNVPFLRRLLGDRKILLMNLVYRQQGFIVRKGNPKGIRGFDDLAGGEVVFINRQRGSGTRLLTDKCLRDLGIQHDAVQGYGREEYTHMGVASAVLSGVADAGMGILAAAQALDLEFVPVARERYDLAILSEYAESEHVAALLGIVRESAEFRSMVEGLGGYETGDMGIVLYES